jgi:hydroxymethylpyrimidine pyrophosphatase-like HAD family hydrolase
LQKEVVSQRRKSKKLINQTALTPTPNFSAIGDQTADYEMIETFNQSLSNSIMHPVETESLKKQNKQVSFSRQQEGALR